MTDQLGHVLKFLKSPKRIVCLVPSLTETLVDMGLTSSIVGVTKFCVHPPSIKTTATVIGGTKNPKIDAILALNPDLIIANKEENRKEDIDALLKHTSVYVSDIKNMDDTIIFIKDMGCIFELEVPKIVSELEKMNSYKAITAFPTCYLIWKDPYMTVGQDTFIHFMMEKYGFSNLFANDVRYPEVSIQRLQKMNPKVILLSSEPYPFKQVHVDELKQHLPTSQIRLVDGELFSWYGSRLLLADKYLKSLDEDLHTIKIEKNQS